MREIVFRGKSINNGQWTEGNMIKNEDATFIVKPMQDSLLDYCLDCPVPFDTDCMHQVIPATVGQYTGLVDKNGKRIFEGDIIMQNDNIIDLVQVCFGEFGVRDIDTEDVVDKVVGFYTRVIPTDAISQMAPFCYDMQLNDFWIKKLGSKVIGNIYDNPELLGCENNV